MSLQKRFCFPLVLLSILFTACPSTQAPGTVRLIRFEASPAAVNTGEVTTLTWNLESLEPGISVQCYLAETPDGGQATDPETVLCKDAKEVAPELSTTYRLEATADGAAIFGKSIIVLVTAITEFSTDKTFIQRGDSVTLNWQAVNSESCFITFKPERGTSTDPKEVKCRGSQSFTPEVTTLYRFSALGPDGETFIEENLTITVD